MCIILLQPLSPLLHSGGDCSIFGTGCERVSTPTSDREEVNLFPDTKHNRMDLDESIEPETPDLRLERRLFWPKKSEPDEMEVECVVMANAVRGFLDKILKIEDEERRLKALINFSSNMGVEFIRSENLAIDISEKRGGHFTLTREFPVRKATFTMINCFDDAYIEGKSHLGMRIPNIGDIFYSITPSIPIHIVGVTVRGRPEILNRDVKEDEEFCPFYQDGFPFIASPDTHIVVAFSRPEDPTLIHDLRFTVKYHNLHEKHRHVFSHMMHRVWFSHLNSYIRVCQGHISKFVR